LKLIVTCEHGGNRIPARYRPLFKRHRHILETHRGYDPGALALARDYAQTLEAELVYSTTSRLLVELNRSHTHRQLFSEMTAGLPLQERERLLARYYHPYREWVDAQIRAAVAEGTRALHLSCHSFTPTLHGVVRTADIGLLYDPGRASEERLCRAWQREIRACDPRLVVRRNYPYRGYTDGLTTALRRRYDDGSYSGIEIEVNQKHPLGDASAWRALRKRLVESFDRARSTLR
jgi:predicted N-formylglutamate amidohydrolase